MVRALAQTVRGAGLSPTQSYFLFIYVDFSCLLENMLFINKKTLLYSHLKLLPTTPPHNLLLLLGKHYAWPLKLNIFNKSCIT